MREEGRGKMLAEIEKRSCTADEERATAMTCFCLSVSHSVATPCCRLAMKGGSEAS